MTDDPIKLFVGCAPNGDDAESMAVLEHSVRRHSSVPVEITWMRLSQQANSPFYSAGGVGWQTRKWATPFSGFRWAIPAMCKFAGRGIYSDSDVIFCQDLALLWRADMGGRVIMAKGGVDSWRFCVSMWDCAAAEQHLPPLPAIQKNPDSHRQLQLKFRQQRGLVQPFGSIDWNVIDGEDFADLRNPHVGALHYSDEAHQPHLELALPRMAAAGRKHWFVANGGKVEQHWRPDVRKLFMDELLGAQAAGYHTESYVPSLPFGRVEMASRVGYSSNKWAPHAHG